MVLNETQLKTLIAEAAKKVVMEYAYHEKQHKPSEEEHEAWLKRKSEAKKRELERQKKEKGEKESDSKAIDYYDYKHGKGNFPVMAKESKSLDSLVARSMRKTLNEMMLPDEGCGMDETTLDYDIDNFSGRWSRGQRYDILVNGDTYYSDIPEDAVDRLYDDLLRSGYSSDEIQIVDL